MTAAVIVDAAGAQMGGAARYLAELRGYLARTGRGDVQVIGAQRRVSTRAGWYGGSWACGPCRAGAWRSTTSGS